jgi:superfamily I DNA/RNA helicase
MPDLTPAQLEIARSPLNAKRFVAGPASCGKTTAGVARLEYLLQNGVPGDGILVLTPQRTLQEPYLDLLRSPQRGPGSEVTPATIGGLARRTCDLFWPLAAEAAGFTHPNRPPIFLTLETAQYYMARLVRPLINEKGLFESVTIDRNRLYAQILDNLNKAAAVGFPHTEIGARLDSAWFGDPAQRRVYADAQECASLFRQYCLEHNLLDFSLQLEIFWDILWPQDTVRAYLQQTYRHLIYDNIEEDIPRAHDLMQEWLPVFDSALLLYDEGGSYRRFLGADAESALGLQALCQDTLRLEESFVITEETTRLAEALTAAIGAEPAPSPLPLAAEGEKPYSFIVSRFYPELLDALAQQIQSLISEAFVPPSEIVILAPYLSDALRFSIMHRLEQASIPVRSHRPSRSLREEPASQCLLTLAALAHPQWTIHPGHFDLARAFMLALDMDLVRAQLLAEIVYRPKDLRLSSFDEIQPEVQERITYVFGDRYTQLREWLLAYRENEPLPLDHFLRSLFGEALSQPGFGFHSDYDRARVTASLIESVYKFRLAMQTLGDEESFDLGREYLSTLQEGVIAAQYLEGWQTEDREAVLVAPAHTFLMMNRPVEVQIWLDIGSSGWTERLAQPLTHPYVLSRGWVRGEAGRLWTDADEVAAATDALGRLVTGLLRRCRRHVYLGLSDLGESGFEQRGGLARAFQKVLQQEAPA